MICWVKATSHVEGGNKIFGKNIVPIFRGEAVYASESVLTTLFTAHIKRCK
jgi:hypothetical protein